jgi:transposase
VDFGRLGLVPDGERRRVCHGLIFTAVFSRHQFVWPTFTQTTEDVICGFEAAWRFFGGVFPVVIPENVPRNISRILWPIALCGSSGNRPEAVLVTCRCRSFRGT